jgi:hypothetical protein
MNTLTNESITLTAQVSSLKLRKFSAGTMAFAAGLPRGGRMHFIEQFFGFAPDGGSGLLEFVVLTFFVSLLALRWSCQHRIGSREQSNAAYKQ